MPERLTVVKREDCYLVAYDEAGDDWVARFELDGVFPAEDWARRMAFLYNSQNKHAENVDTEDLAGLEPDSLDHN